jgi:hypothetical protein
MKISGVEIRGAKSIASGSSSPPERHSRAWWTKALDAAKNPSVSVYWFVLQLKNFPSLHSVLTIMLASYCTNSRSPQPGIRRSLSTGLSWTLACCSQESDGLCLPVCSESSPVNSGCAQRDGYPAETLHENWTLRVMKRENWKRSKPNVGLIEFTVFPTLA